MKPTDNPQAGENWAVTSTSGYGSDNRLARRQARRMRQREAVDEAREQLADQ